MRNFKIAVKLIVPFAIVLIFFFAQILFLFTQLKSVESELNFFHAGLYGMKGAISDMRSEFERVQKYLYMGIADYDTAVSRAAAASAQRNFDQCLESFGRVRESNDWIQQTRGDEELQQLVTGIADGMEGIRPELEEATGLVEKNRREEAVRYVRNTLASSASGLDSDIQTLVTAADARADAVLQNYAAIQQKMMVALYVSLGVSSTVVILGCVFLTRSLNRPIRELKDAAEEMAKGNLQVQIGYTSRDELGQLAQSMRSTMTTLSGYVDNIDDTLGKMAGGDFTVQTDMEYLGDFARIRGSITEIVDSLNETMGSINRASQEVAGGSQQVSGGAQALSQGATEQASSIQELAAALVQESGQIKGSAEGAARANKLVEQNGTEIAACSTQMEKMVHSMQRINSAASQVGKIVKTIEDIAFQTNILALNAAVEAARAGAAGKGFAVVADEVRSLATKSSDAAKNSTALIGEVITAIGDGGKIVEGTQQSLQKVVESSREIGESIEKIADASNAQADSINQITAAVDQISAVVQTNSATAEEAAAASEELSGQSQVLKELVGRVTLRGVSGAGYHPALSDGSDCAPADEDLLLAAGGSKYDL